MILVFICQQWFVWHMQCKETTYFTTKGNWECPLLSTAEVAKASYRYNKAMWAEIHLSVYARHFSHSWAAVCKTSSVWTTGAEGERLMPNVEEYNCGTVFFIPIANKYWQLHFIRMRYSTSFTILTQWLTVDRHIIHSNMEKQCQQNVIIDDWRLD